MSPKLVWLVYVFVSDLPVFWAQTTTQTPFLTSLTSANNRTGINDLPVFSATQTPFLTSLTSNNNRTGINAGLTRAPQQATLPSEYSVRNNATKTNTRTTRVHQQSSHSTTTLATISKVYEDGINSTAWIAAPIILGVLGLLLFLLFLYILYRSRCCGFLNEQTTVTETAMDSRKAVGSFEEGKEWPPETSTTASFPTYVDRLHEHDDYAFSSQFKTLSRHNNLHSVSEAASPYNVSKNRYSNILPYNESRVKLPSDLANDDYINASYIPGVSSSKKYIASQGPMEETVNDFWSMVLHERVNTIVMLTKLVEMGREKCLRYWPNREEGELDFGSNTVRLLEEQNAENFNIRKLKVSNNIRNTSADVVQYQTKSWQDHATPEDMATVLELIRRLNENREMMGDTGREDEATGPILVHCSAGVGPTGTFILIDRVLQQLNPTSTTNDENNNNNNKVKAFGVYAENNVIKKEKSTDCDSR